MKRLILENSKFTKVILVVGKKKTQLDLDLPHIMQHLDISKSEAKRLIKQGAVTIILDGY